MLCQEMQPPVFVLAVLQAVFGSPCLCAADHCPGPLAETRALSSSGNPHDPLGDTAGAEELMKFEEG